MILATQWSFSSNKMIINIWFEYCDKVIVYDIFVIMLQLRYYSCYLFTTRMHLEVGANCLPNPPCHCSCFSEDIMMGNVLNSRVQVNWFVGSLQHLSTNTFFLFYITHSSTHQPEILHVFCQEPHWFFDGITFGHAPLGLLHAPHIPFLNLVHLFYIIHPLNVDQTTHINLFNKVYHKACHHIKERSGHLHLQHA